MKQNLLLPLARVASALSLLVILACFHMVLTLTHFLPSQAAVMNTVYIFFFVGIALGVVLCPLFLPVPNSIFRRVLTEPWFPYGKNKPLKMSMGFIAFLLLIECIFRFQGAHAWLNSIAIRSITAIPEGILFTMGHGLFFLTWLRQPEGTDESGDIANRTGKWCSLIFCVILLASVLVRYYSVPLMERGIAAADPFAGIAFSFSFITWGVLAAGLSAAVSVYFVHAANAAVSCNLPSAGEGAGPESSALASVPVATDWSVILRLIGLAAVFTILSGVLNLPIFSLYSGDTIFHPHFLTTVAVVPVLVFLAGFSTNRFIRRFLPSAIILFILISCLPLFDEQHQLNMIISTLVAIAHYTIWVVFTTAVVEHYHGSFWFYGMAMAIFVSAAFAFLAPVINPFLPEGEEYRVLYIAIAAILFMLLAFRLLFKKPASPGAGPAQEPFPSTLTFEDIFRERKLSQREIEVANLLVKEGYGAKEIAGQLYIATGTAKIHISKIYQKFAVKTRAEFMALFVNSK